MRFPCAVSISACALMSALPLLGSVLRHWCWWCTAYGNHQIPVPTSVNANPGLKSSLIGNLAARFLYPGAGQERAPAPLQTPKPNPRPLLISFSHVLPNLRPVLPGHFFLHICYWQSTKPPCRFVPFVSNVPKLSLLTHHLFGPGIPSLRSQSSRFHQGSDLSSPVRS